MGGIKQFFLMGSSTLEQRNLEKMGKQQAIKRNSGWTTPFGSTNTFCILDLIPYL